MSFSWINPDSPYKIVMSKVAAGNGIGKIEYLCETDVLSAATSDAVWRIRKFVYDAGHFLTNIYWADASSKFEKTVDAKGTYTYS